VSDRLLSPHFSVQEIACPCCGALPPEERLQPLLACLEALRERYGHPMPVSSGYRCPRHNAAVGGAATSAHLLCAAADVRVEDSALRRRFVEAAIRSQIPGIGVYPSHVHIDIEDRPVPVLWWGKYGRRQ